MKILALKTRRLGDTVLWTAALNALTQFSSTDLNSSIDIAYPEPYHPLFDQDSRFRRQLPLCPEILSWESFDAIRNEKYDVILNFHASSRSALLSHLSGAKTRVIHFHSRHAKKAFKSLEIPNLGVPMSAVERDLNVIRALGWNDSSPAPQLNLSSTLLERGHSLLRQNGINLDEPIIGISLDASRPAKLWGDENYLRLCQDLRKLAQPVIFYEKKDFEKRAFYKELRKFAFPVHTPNLQDVLGCLPHCKLLIGSDSGLKHIAVALNVRTLTLFGPESVGEWHGYDKKIHPYIQIPVLCRNRDPEPKEYAWCGEYSCPYASHSCMNLIEVKEVLKQSTELILQPS